MSLVYLVWQRDRSDGRGGRRLGGDGEDGGRERRTGRVKRGEGGRDGGEEKVKLEE